ncbi:hypothetical protein [Halosimplex sp. J119]
MAFDNVTLFEVHLDGAQFGPATTSDRDDEGRSERPAAPRRDSETRSGKSAPVTAAEPSAESTDDGGSGRNRVVALVAASVVLSVIATVVAKRLASRGDPDLDVDSPENAESEPYTSEGGSPVAGPSAPRDQ